VHLRPRPSPLPTATRAARRARRHRTGGHPRGPLLLQRLPATAEFISEDGRTILYRWDWWRDRPARRSPPGHPIPARRGGVGRPEHRCHRDRVAGQARGRPTSARSPPVTSCGWPARDGVLPSSWPWCCDRWSPALPRGERRLPTWLARPRRGALRHRGGSSASLHPALFHVRVHHGLGEDYNILLMTRIREEAATSRCARPWSPPSDDGDHDHLGRTGAGGTFGILAIATSGQVRQIGTGLSLGILLDTFVVRTLLVPRRWCCSGGGTGGRRACSPSALWPTAVDVAPVLAAPPGPGPDHLAATSRAAPVFSNRARPSSTGGEPSLPHAPSRSARTAHAVSAPSRPGPLEGLGDRGDRDRPSPTETQWTRSEGSGCTGDEVRGGLRCLDARHRRLRWLVAEPPARAHAGRRLRRARCSEPGRRRWLLAVTLTIRALPWPSRW